LKVQSKGKITHEVTWEGKILIFERKYILSQPMPLSDVNIRSTYVFQEVTVFSLTCHLATRKKTICDIEERKCTRICPNKETTIRHPSWTKQRVFHPVLWFSEGVNNKISMAFKGKTIQGVLLSTVVLFVVEQTNFFQVVKCTCMIFPLV